MSHTKKIQNSKFKIQNSQKGVSLYLSMVIMAILLGLALGISTILLGQIKVIKGMGDSVVAFYAADTGIEEVMMSWTSPGDIDITSISVGSETAYYRVIVKDPGEDGCTALNHCIQSLGWYQKTRRAIEITY